MDITILKKSPRITSRCNTVHSHPAQGRRTRRPASCPPAAIHRAQCSRYRPVRAKHPLPYRPGALPRTGLSPRSGLGRMQYICIEIKQPSTLETGSCHSASAQVIHGPKPGMRPECCSTRPDRPAKPDRRRA